MGDVYAYPASSELFGGGDGGAAATEGIEDYVALIRGRLNDSLKQGLGFWSGVAEAFSGAGADGLDVRPQVLEGHARHLVQVTLVLGDVAGAGLHHASIGNELVHSLFAVSPVAGDAHHLVGGVAFSCATGAGHVVESISSTCCFLSVSVELVQVILIIFGVEGVPRPIVALGVEEDEVADAAVLLSTLAGVAVGAGALPNNLGAELVLAEGCVHEKPEIVSRRRVAVEVDAAGGLEHAVKLDQAGSHHHEVGGHGVAAEELAHGGDHFLHVQGRFRILDDVEFVGAFRFLGPLPGVGEGFYLGGGIFAGLLAEEDVVVGVGIEGRVQVDEVYGLVGDVFAENGEVVAVVEGVGGGDVIRLGDDGRLLPAGNSICGEG